MDLATMMDTLAAQGALFWAATGSVALGATLVIVATVAQVRRLRRKRPVRIREQDNGSAPRAAEPAPTIAKKETPVEIALPAPPMLKDPEQVDFRELRQMAARLRSAGDRLEEFRRHSGPEPARNTESPLKEAHSPVDYVFRAGLG